MIAEFEQYLSLQKRYSKHTVLAYTTDLTKCAEYALETFSQSNMLLLSHKQIRLYLAHLMQQKISARSVNRVISSLRAFFKYAYKHGAITENPMLKIIAPKMQKKLPVFVSKQSMQQLQDMDNSMVTQEKDTYTELLNYTIMQAFYNLGLRLSELIHLQEKNIDFYNRTVKVLGKGKKERAIPFSPAFNNVLSNYIKIKQGKFGDTIKNDYLFVTKTGNKLYEKFVYRVTTQTLLNCTTLTKRSPHVLRHTFATHISDNGAEINDIKELLGHANLTATQIYTHSSIKKLKNTFKQAHPKA